MARVAVAMSGGVDSSVAAALLCERGYEVIGVALRLWGEEEPPEAEGSGPDRSVPRESPLVDGVLPPSPASIADARRVALQLGIPFHVLDVRDPFSQRIISHFLREYLAGRTPSPCLFCNAQVKFSSLLRFADASGIDFVASGHYAQIAHDPHRGRFLLRRSIDLRKDQSYFLAFLSQAQLARILMPIGDLHKEQTRRLASAMGLPVARKEESQEVCFIPDGDVQGFLRRRAQEPIVPGEIRDLHGTRLGKHPGIAFYTVGQRKGLGIARGHPLYVVKLDAQRNEVVVGREEDLWSSDLVAEGVHFLPFDRLSQELEVWAQIRYQGRGGQAWIRPSGEGTVEVRFAQAQRAIAPGQAVVFYQGDLLIGGGTITRSGRASQR